MMMRISVILAIICLLFVFVNTRKVKRQATFDLGFQNNRRPTNFGQFLGGLFGGQQGGGNNANTNNNPFGGLFDAFSGVNAQIDCSINNGGCQQGCRVVRGRRQCYCHEGYHLHIDDGSCHDNDECVEFRPCEDHCENTVGSYVCHCNSGIVRPDGTCDRGSHSAGSGNFGGIGFGTQSCNQNNGGCEQKCGTTRNGIQCQCNTGYSISPIDSRSCIDLDECSTGTHSCRGRCVNTIGSYRCHDGAFPISSVQRCSTNNGGCEYKCQDKQNGVTCSCYANSILHSDGKSCVNCLSGSITLRRSCPDVMQDDPSPIDCNLNNGGCQQRCRKPRRGRGQSRCVCNARNFVIQSDKRSCACKVGFALSFDGNRCTADGPAGTADVVSCDIDNGGCQHACRARARKTVCTCRRNFQLQPDKKSCLCQQGLFLSRNGRQCTRNMKEEQSVDPCTVNNGGCQQNCMANGNQAECYCNNLYTLAADGTSCVSVGPCTTQNGGCDDVCHNNNGIASCSCRVGYNLGADGKRCIKIVTTIPPPHSPPKINCGTNNKKDLLRRIVGGKPADPKDWPWMAAILRKDNDQNFCGGVLISDKHILTAAHCLVHETKDTILVRLGEYDFAAKEDNQPTDFIVVNLKRHENYNTTSEENDIAILTLDRPSTFSEFIWPVCLPPANDEFMHQLGYVTGWGKTQFGGIASRILQEVIVPVWTQKDCNDAYPSKVAATMMCAGLIEGGKDSCQGDSGGPYLAQVFPDSRWSVIGVVSWGRRCAEPGNPGVYTRVNKYLSWIQQNTSP